MQIRVASASDRESIQAIWDEAQLPSISAQEWSSLLGSPNASVLLAEDGGAMAGAAVASFDGWRAYIYHVAVVPAQRGKGIARRLFQDAEARLREQGAGSVYIMVHEQNTAGLALAGETGYEPEQGELIFRKDLA